MKKICISTLVLFTIFLVACSNDEHHNAESNEITNAQDNSNQNSTNNSDKNANTWDAINAEGINIISRINTPESYTREEVLQDSFAWFVRNYSLKDDGSAVLLYNSSEKQSQDHHIAVFDMSLVEGDLQQCADSIMRMYAEYYYKQKEFHKIKFYFVNGFLCDFETWADGYRVDVNGNETSWVKKAEYSDDTETLEKYLTMVFSYSSTLSMEQESELQSIEELEIGDVFLMAGSPGHVVMVVDVCKNDKGEKAFLLAQGYMPAQEFHILKNPADNHDPWYYAKEVEFPFATPEYTFEEGSLRTLLY